MFFNYFFLHFQKQKTILILINYFFLRLTVTYMGTCKVCLFLAHEKQVGNCDCLADRKDMNRQHSDNIQGMVRFNEYGYDFAKL